MNYLEHYNRLIERAKNRDLACYTELHHIIPRCMSGTDEKHNLVRLTAREHFIAHLLLYKIYPKEHGLIKAINMMCVKSESHFENRINNRMYSWLKEKLSAEMSRCQSGENNSQFGTMWIYNIETFESLKIFSDEIIPDGWSKGRKMKLRDNNVIKSNCVVCNLELSQNSKSKYKTCSYMCTIKLQKIEGTYINGFKNKSHSDLTKNSMKNHTRNNGVNNPMFGMKYIHNPETFEYKRCKDDILQNHLNDGWKYGMKPR